MLEGQKYACININMPSSVYGVSISGHKENGTIRAQSLATVICGLLRGFKPPASNIMAGLIGQRTF